MNDEEVLLAGEFGTASRLSPKALRLYADRGLLVPAHTDPVTGYRYYRRDQIAQARLISRLRALELPLARISMLLGVSAEARRAELQAWLGEQEDELRRRRDLVDTLEGGAERLTGEVATRHVPEQKLAYRERRLYIDTLDDFIGDSERRIRTRLREAGLSDDGQLRVHYHGQVTRDSDGPVEVSVAFTGSLEPVDDLRIRLAPAHLEAHLPVSEPDSVFPDILRVYHALEAWIDANKLVCTASPLESYPGTGEAIFDVAYPVSTEKS